MTAQVHEKITIDGKRTSMAFCPPIPENHPLITMIPFEEYVPTREDGLVGSTACWRGYIGSWSIKDDKFYLTKIQGPFKIKGRQPIFAEWFSGVLRIPQGKLLHYVHMGFGSVYEKELHVKIEKGVVIKRRVVDAYEMPLDWEDLTWRNLPGGENNFFGDDW
mgnify:CR=1 FL=1